MKTKVAILGAGQIGRAAYQILSDLGRSPQSINFLFEIDAFVIDADQDNISKLVDGSHLVINLVDSSIEDIAEILISRQVTHVINALPFSLNEKAASVALSANCSYIDFTEDDIMADKVQKIFKDSNLNCAVKCGLAPGFINYIGYKLVGKIDTPDSLMISVGALPRNVSYSSNYPEYSYNLSWSVDGLVNEYIRPCRVRRNGELKELAPLGNLTTVILDGVEYEAAYTSGGVGNLARDLTNVPNVAYMTLRYPGHYRYVRAIVQEAHGNFDKIKKVFLEVFPFTDDDVIVVYANALGKDKNGNIIRRNYANKFYGVNGLSGIQSTTAAAGIAMLELMLAERVKGIINQTDVPFDDFTNTQAFTKYYKTGK
jgi:saccharopine dehydrogenase-like NADP-dependent oxidoreductase